MAGLYFVWTVMFLAGCSIAFTVERSHQSVHPEYLPSRAPNARQLQAAQLQSKIGTRDIGQAVKHDYELHYVDDEFDAVDERLAAQVHISAKLPTLVLEDLDHHLNEVTCSQSAVILVFNTAVTHSLALEELNTRENFYLVTSHDNCNDNGQRGFYLISAVSSTERKLSLTLSASRVHLKNAIKNIRIDFGKTGAEDHVARSNSLRKRQDESATAAATSTIAAPAFPTVSSSISTPTSESTHKDLGFSFIDTSLLPPQFPGVDSASLNAPFVPHGVSVQCKNCTLAGSIDIIQGSLSKNMTDTSSNDTSNIIDFFYEDGFIEFQANGLLAHMEFETVVQPSASLASYKAPLPPIGLPGFQIPGVGVVGPIFQPILEIGAQISSQLDFTYGFNLTVPDNSTIVLEAAHIENSTITGFPDSQITALPFGTNIDNVALTVSAAFRPTLLLGISLLDGEAFAGAGVFFNLPTVSATVSQVAHVNSKCEPITNNGTTSNSILDDVFGSLTHIEENVEFDFGLVAEASLGAAGVNDIHTVFNTSFPLPTACLSFDSDKSTLGPVTASGSGTQSGARASETAQGAAAAGAVNPLRRLLSAPGRIESVLGALMFVSICFGGL